MIAEALNLSLVVDEAHVADCAAALQERLRPNQWKILAALAAEIVSRWESAAAGSRVLVVPADRAAERVARDLGLVLK